MVVGGRSILISGVLLIVIPLGLHLIGVRGFPLDVIRDGLRIVDTFIDEDNKRADTDDNCAGAETHWKSAEQINSRKVYEDHLRLFGNCKFATLAKERLKLLTDSPVRAGGLSTEDYETLRNIYK